MKQNKLYVAPQMDVIKIESQGVLCSSGSVETSDFNGTGMNFTRRNGEW